MKRYQLIILLLFLGFQANAQSPCPRFLICRSPDLISRKMVDSVNHLIEKTDDQRSVLTIIRSAFKEKRYRGLTLLLLKKRGNDTLSILHCYLGNPKTDETDLSDQMAVRGADETLYYQKELVAYLGQRFCVDDTLLFKSQIKNTLGHPLYFTLTANAGDGQDQLLSVSQDGNWTKAILSANGQRYRGKLLHAKLLAGASEEVDHVFDVYFLTSNDKEIIRKDLASIAAMSENQRKSKAVFNYFKAYMYIAYGAMSNRDLLNLLHEIQFI